MKPPLYKPHNIVFIYHMSIHILFYLCAVTCTCTEYVWAAGISDRSSM